MTNMQTHHVCYSRSLGCSAVNPCRLCFDAVCENVLPAVARAFAMNFEQARYLRTLFEEAYERFHEQARFDPALTEAALDLRRVVIAPLHEEAPPYHRPNVAPFVAPQAPYPTYPQAPLGSVYGRSPEAAPAAPPAPIAAPQRTALGGQSWPTREAPRAPVSRGVVDDIEPDLVAALQNLDPGVLAALTAIGDAAAQGKTPAIPAGLDVEALLSAVLPGIDVRTLDIESLAKTFLPPGTDVSAIASIVAGEMERRSTPGEEAATAPNVVALPNTPEKRAERRAERRRAESQAQEPARKPALPTPPAPEPTQLSADDFADAAEPAPPPPATTEPNGAPKPS